MNPVCFNFASKTRWALLWQLSAATVFSAVFGTVALGIAILKWADLNEEGARLTEETAGLQHVLRQNRARASHAPRALLLHEGQVVALNSAIERLNLPWSELFDALDAATPADIALLSLDIRSNGAAIKGVAEAENTDNAFAYIQALGARPELAAPVITRHEINEQVPGKPVRFQFEAIWTRGVP